MSWKGYDAEWLNRFENRRNENKSRPQVPNPKPPQRPDALASHCQREAQGTECPVVRFTLRRVQLLDVDAKYASIKDLLDGLRHAGLIRGDKEGEVDLKVEQERVDSYTLEETLIEIDLPCLS